MYNYAYALGAGTPAFRTRSPSGMGSITSVYNGLVFEFYLPGWRPTRSGGRQQKNAAFPSPGDPCSSLDRHMGTCAVAAIHLAIVLQRVYLRLSKDITSDSASAR